MKKLFLAALIFVFCMGIASAAPFLVCTPDQTAKEYVLTLNSGEEIITTAPLRFDLGELEPGEYIGLIKAKINQWTGPLSDPFGFTKPLILSPTGIGLSD